MLPERTHPEVMMSGGGGYLLSGIVVDDTEPEGFDNSFAKSDNRSNGRKKQRRNWFIAVNGYSLTLNKTIFLT